MLLLDIFLFLDATYGWNGFTQGMTLYYSHVSDLVEDDTHSIPLSPGLTPVVRGFRYWGKRFASLLYY